MSKNLKLGIIGISDGNGHPYSWASIFNGYNSKLMEECGFPVIPRYLEKQNFPEDTILNASVTHIWTQDYQVSKKIAMTTNIQNVIKDPEEFIGSVDAVLLARDDADKSRVLAHPIINAGLPIYIDKPIALSVNKAKELLNMQKYEGQIFSCSALLYDQSLELNKNMREKLGSIKSINATISKDWDKYAVHIIDPLLKMIPYRGKIKNSKRWVSDDQTKLSVEFQNNLDVHLHTTGSLISNTKISISGENGSIDLFTGNTFKCFKSTLQDFIDGIISKEVKTSSKQILDTVELIELGR